jgi:hypothetical protein
VTRRQRQPQKHRRKRLSAFDAAELLWLLARVQLGPTAWAEVGATAEAVIVGDGSLFPGRKESVPVPHDL